MNVRTIALSAVLAAAVGPAAAQQATDPLRSQIMTLEDVLRRAIEVAGETLSAQVKEKLQAPFPVQFGFDPVGPVVRGWPIESYGYHFDVQVPDVAETGMLVVQMQMLLPRQGPGARPTGPAQPVASGGIVKADPMGRGAGPSPGEVAVAGTPFDPNVITGMYRENVRAALMDAIISNPAVLNLRPTDTLIVSAAGVGQGTLYRLSPRSTRLMLYISGADLAALREGRLSHEEARKRIRERTF